LLNVLVKKIRTSNFETYISINDRNDYLLHKDAGQLCISQGKRLLKEDNKTGASASQFQKGVG